MGMSHSLQSIQDRVESIAPRRYEVQEINGDRCTLLDKEWGVVFSYNTKSFLSNLKKAPERSFWSAVRGNVVSVIGGESPFNVEARLRLSRTGILTNFEVVSYKPDTGRVLLKDRNTSVEEEYDLNSYLGNLRRGKAQIQAKTLKDSAQEALDAEAPNRFHVKSVWKDSKNRNKTTVAVFDTKYSTEIVAHLSYIVHRLRRDSEAAFSCTKEESNKRRKATNVERFGASAPLQNAAVLAKMRETVVTRYGVNNVFQLPEIKQKVRKTNLKRYGVENAMLNADVRKRAIEASVDKYEGIHHTQHPAVRAKARTTNVERWGHPSALANELVKKKIRNTFQEKYGVVNPQQDPEIQARAQQTRIENGITHTFEGKTIKQIAEEAGASYSNTQKLIAKYGYDFAKPLLDAYSPGGSLLTKAAVQMLSPLIGEEPIVDRKMPGCSFRPDLRFDSSKLIVECDGLYWHSEAARTETWNPTRSYHQRKLELYESLGYRALFFRSDEILNKERIVKSIVLNAAQKNAYSVAARKCSIEEISPEFFTRNHLMGAGSGRCYGLVYEGKAVAGIQVRWARKEKGLLDVSRFCTLNNTTVMGAWSRLIKHATQTERPSFIQTFIDRRYGTGAHLKQGGWTLESNTPSFMWTDGITTCHRMRYPGNTGREAGMSKIWDCGQAKWVLRT